LKKAEFVCNSVDKYQSPPSNTYNNALASLETNVAANKPYIGFLKAHFPLFWSGQLEVL